MAGLLEPDLELRTGLFAIEKGRVPFTFTTDVLVVVFRVDGDDEVRWARRVSE